MGASSRIRDDRSKEAGMIQGSWHISQGMQQLPAALQLGFSRRETEASRRRRSPAKRWLWTSGLQNCKEYILSCCRDIKSAALLLWQQETNTRGNKVPFSWLSLIFTKSPQPLCPVMRCPFELTSTDQNLREPHLRTLEILYIPYIVLWGKLMNWFICG